MQIISLFHSWSVDITGPLLATKTGKKYLIVTIEHMPGWLKAGALALAKNSMAVNVIRKEVLSTFGTPVIFLSENGTHFSSSYVRDNAIEEGIKRDKQLHMIQEETVESNE